ncbi:MAG: argininosuccinate lyase, partial [Thermodesulfobacteriota bacterium]
YLVNRGLPFREAHHVIGRVVAHCIEVGKGLEELTLAEWKSFSTAFDDDIRQVVSVKASVDSRNVEGGTALRRVKRRLKEIEGELKAGKGK